MARVFQYIRPVNAILTSVNLENKVNLTENGIRIKEEPLDLDYDDLNPLLNNVDETAENVSNDVRYQRSDVANNENSGCRLRIRPGKSKVHVAKRKRKRVSDSDLKSQESQQPKKRKTYARVLPRAQNQQSTEEIVYICDICFVSFYSEKGLFNHKKLYRDVVVCKICNMPFCTPQQVKKHVEGHCMVQVYDSRIRPRCSLCTRKFSDKVHLQMHLFHCHKNLVSADQMVAKKAVAKDTAEQVIVDFDKFEEVLRITNGAAKDADKIEGNECTKNTTTQVIRDIDNIGRITRSRNSLLTTISDFDKFVENIRIEDIMNRGHSDGDRLDDDMCMEDTLMRTDKDRCEDDAGMEDTTIPLTKDVEETENETRRKESVIRVTNDVYKLEENIRIENAARREIRNADKVEGNASAEEGTNDVAVNGVLSEENTATECDTNYVISVPEAVEGNTLLVTNDAEVEATTPSEDNTNLATNNAEEMEGNTPVEDNTNPVTNNVDKTVENKPVENSANHVTENTDKIQRNELAEATASNLKKSVVEIEQSPSTPRTRQLVRGTNTPSKSSTSRSGKKKMRQTTLTEFISFSGKTLKENCIKTERVDEGSFDANEQDTKNWTPSYASTPLLQKSSAKNAAIKIATINTPLIRMHMNPDAIISLLNDQVKIEPVDEYSLPAAHSSLYNLKKARDESCPSPFVSHNASPATRFRPTATPWPRIAKMPLEQRLRVKYKCKECTVRLERCDHTYKRVMFKTDKCKSVIPLQLTIENHEKSSLNGKEKSSSPKIRIMTLDNCIVVELLEPR